MEATMTRRAGWQYGFSAGMRVICGEHLVTVDGFKVERIGDTWTTWVRYTWERNGQLGSEEASLDQFLHMLSANCAYTAPVE